MDGLKRIGMSGRAFAEHWSINDPAIAIMDGSGLACERWAGGRLTRKML